MKIEKVRDIKRLQNVSSSLCIGGGDKQTNRKKLIKAEAKNITLCLRKKCLSFADEFTS